MARRSRTGKRERKEKKSNHNQWDPFCFSGNLLLAPNDTNTLKLTGTEEHDDWNGVWLCAFVSDSLSYSMCDWLYLRQGPFCFKPENGSETKAGPIIGLLRPCLAWEKSPWPDSAKLTFVFSCRGQTCWSEFRLGQTTTTPSTTTSTLNTLLPPLLKMHHKLIT